MQISIFVIDFWWKIIIHFMSSIIIKVKRKNIKHQTLNRTFISQEPRDISNLNALENFLFWAWKTRKIEAIHVLWKCKFNFELFNSDWLTFKCHLHHLQQAPLGVAHCPLLIYESLCQKYQLDLKANENWVPIF